MESNAFFVNEQIDEGKVIPFCKCCDKRPSCKKICPELEKSLPKISQGKLVRGEHSFDPVILERILNEKIGKEYTCGGGKRKKPVIEE